jgi:predicted dienelactone hydrolase
MNKSRLIFIVLILPICATATYADRLNFHVGVRQFSVYFQPTKSEIKSIIWYPTPVKSKVTKFGPYELEVAKNAEIENGKHNLVVISHGSRGSHMGHRDTAIYLAERGYIVISVLHPKNNYLDDSAGRTNENWVNRPQHISSVLDSILAVNDYKDYINKNRIAVIGHSAGGYTALALVGGVPDTATIDIHCRDHSDDTEFCGGHNSFFLRIKNLFSNQDSENSHIINNLYDQRIKAAVLLAPVGVLFKDKKSLSKVKIPIRIYRAEKDEVLRYPYHAESIRKKLTIVPEYIIVKNAGHYSCLSPLSGSLKNRIGAPAKDPEGFDRIHFHKIMNQEIADFLFRSL